MRFTGIPKPDTYLPILKKEKNKKRALTDEQVLEFIKDYKQKNMKCFSHYYNTLVNPLSRIVYYNILTGKSYRHLNIASLLSQS